MKKSISYLNKIKLGLALSSLVSMPIYALNPVQGWYAGVILGASYMPAITIEVPVTTKTALATYGINTAKTSASISHNVLGNIGGQVGYRCNNFRLEIEGLYNNNPLDVLRIGSYRVESPSTSATLRLNGETAVGAGLVNGYYDFFSPDGSSNIVPYVGVGAGYAYVRSQIEFYYNNVLISNELSNSNSSIVGQGIIGVSYFLDDFTAMAVDFRYFTSAKTSPIINTRLTYYAVNATFNGAFDFG
jgi:opacity protein-like surface antigen